MAGYVVEPQRRLAVRDRYDVIVVGGGIAGVAAAVAAAREGAKTCLIEKEYALGGLATLGNIIVYLPLCDGMGHKVSAGLAESLLKLSVRDGSQDSTSGGRDIPDCWKHAAPIEQRAAQRYITGFNPATYALAMEHLALKQHIELLYDTRFCGVHKRGDRIDAVIIEDKGGRSALSCKAVIDASGDADVCMAAGETLAHCDVNVPCGWFYATDGKKNVELVPHSQDFDFLARSLPKGSSRGFALRDSRDASQMHITSNQEMQKRIGQMRTQRNDPQIHMLRPPAIASFRMTRRLVGEIELHEKDDRTFFHDTVGMIGHWRRSGPVYCIPLRALTGVKTANLMAVGRCMSSAHDAWDITRVIPACAVTGEAAGAAAAMLIRTGGKALRRLDVPALQHLLKRRRVILDPRLMANRAAQ